ncbi:hypothetical protein BACCIP111895_04234 [Neobacillus rhizosphaerae]|uniref:Flagellar hook-length control protein-like C-terminal domain-containing protein n=1 Tax=Neobacillus rhizosphaerae TaxID=2880965 RepID=A0ABN8KX67_9BACI|nr:hypothetical protein [Neobacillus rhizosphaerae]CAH2717045.1 hypothetical protein BACCIP111895_04234 [Neobacillus rhizosphaerae]
MNPVHMIQSLLNVENLPKDSLFSLRQGQLIYGKVQKFFQNNTALIQLGNVKLYAQLKASLSAGNSYWFEVQSNDGAEIHLKVVEGIGQNTSQQSIHSLLKHFQLPETKINLQFVQFLLSKNLPITKGHLVETQNWINKKTDFPKATAAIEYMIKKDLPFTKQIFQSLVAVQESKSFTSQLEQLGRFLEDPKFYSLKSTQPLKQMIGNILENSSINQVFSSIDDQLPSGTEVKKMLESMIHSLGLEYDKEVEVWSKVKQESFESLDSLKPLLLKAMSELGNSGRELEPIINRLTGMQLISQETNGPMLQILMQLPILLGEKKSDVTLQWSGRKTSNGQIDPNYCRILFYLELQSIQHTVIDMHIQNKLIHITVINDTKEIETIITTLKPSLKEKLDELGYNLSFIKVIPPYEKDKLDEDQMNSSILLKDGYQEVDIKI